MVELNRRDMLQRGAGLALAATIANGGSPSWASQSTLSSVDPMQLVHPELRIAAAQVQAMAATFPPPSDAALPQVRQAGPVQPPLSTVPYTKRTIAVRGAPNVDIYIINAKRGTRRPGIIHLHGGGFISGSAAASIRNLQQIAAHLECCIVTVEYRLAPETRYSGSIEDNHAGLVWLYEHAEELGVDRDRIAVMGESAGGGHAALLAIAARDRGQVPLAFQCLVYPMLDDRTGSTTIVPTHIGTLLWTAPTNRYAWRSFLGSEPGGAAVPSAAVPARVADLGRLPPAWIGVGSLDLFVGEDIEYAGRLINAGVPTEVAVVPGAFHGFDVIAAETSVAKRFTGACLAALKRALT